jgi:hypothetical protein
MILGELQRVFSPPAENFCSLRRARRRSGRTKTHNEQMSSCLRLLITPQKKEDLSKPEKEAESTSEYDP